MKTKFVPFTLKSEAGAIPITFEQARSFLSEDEISKGEKRFEIESRGPWGICSKISGIATTATWKSGPVHRIQDTMTILGRRTMSNPRSMGYDMEGRVSVSGKRWRAFTSSNLFQLPDGKLVDVAILHVCIGQK